MARPRGFDEDRAIEAAMRAFWGAGYEGTSTQDLCVATGLGRSSVYNTFTSKRDLFARALRHYMADRNASIAELLGGDLPARERIRAMLWGAVDPPPGEPAGCLVVNSMVEVAPHDAELAGVLSADYDRRLKMLVAVLEEGMRAGEVDPGKDATALAHFVIATIGGLRVAGRGGADRATLEAIATTAMTAI
ncbi:TetR/AcrR family transcriptional regulator [Spongiactinospora sp. TRM90649]|uniref:TetR/AcrR family transcriptional regulator n=1 Tax=Spongiactinospora sp. TRM90649 TaxID=3031114 RepID=UPI0023F6280E|nr:TetR/AcrR family transcriptional regulator [Spongiactinospora sp. TRM90649]MDF5756411.1 TetR/AcrR family transcriptional regulator [Spongiactinospora sp. TRM90649]